MSWRAGAIDRYVSAFLGPSTDDGGFAVSFPPPHRHPQLFSAFAQDQIDLVENELALTLGSKLEHNAFTGFEVQSTARLLWTPSARQSIWAAVSRAVRTPNLSEDGIGTRQLPVSTTPPLFPRLTGNPDFDPESLLAYELGARAQATPNLSLDLRRSPGFSKSHDGRDLRRGAQRDLAAADWARFYGAYRFLKMNLHVDPTLAAGTRARSEGSEGISW